MRRIVIITCILFITLSLTSCSTTPKDSPVSTGGGSSKSVQAAKQKIIDAVATQNIDALLSLLPSDYEHAHFGSKTDIQYILSETKKLGYFDDMHLSFINTQFKEDDKGNASLSPIDVSGNFGYITFHLYFKKYDKGWLVHRVIVDV